MAQAQRIPVLGEEVELLVTCEQTGGSLCTVIQHCPPGGGPPPHRHENEDELFMVLEGEFETFDGAAWHKLPLNEPRYGPRGNWHTFRNCGSTPGKMLITVVPGAFEDYLRAISPLHLPEDLERLLEISRQHGVSFQLTEPPAP